LTNQRTSAGNGLVDPASQSVKVRVVARAADDSSMGRNLSVQALKVAAVERQHGAVSARRGGQHLRVGVTRPSSFLDRQDVVTHKSRRRSTTP
jgi:hypothetical protein